MDVNTTAWLHFIVQWQVKLSISINLTESQPSSSTQRLAYIIMGTDMTTKFRVPVVSFVS
jgi:hypothetical protein